MKKLGFFLLAVVIFVSITGCSDADPVDTPVTTMQITTTTTSYEDYQWQQKYGNLPTARAVQYDKYKYAGYNFTISGVAELDDYYNYGYASLEPLYFCIWIQPTGGSFSDGWYVYASRDTFSELYNSLLNGTKRVTLIARLVFADTGLNNMATLVDYQ